MEIGKRDGSGDYVLTKGWTIGCRPSAHRPVSKKHMRRVFELMERRRLEREREKNPFTELVSGVLLTPNDVRELERRKAKRDAR